jgi:5-methylcytosine-specific restriction endonuclease McrA
MQQNAPQDRMPKEIKAKRINFHNKVVELQDSGMMYGHHVMDNLRCCCQSCNSLKGDRVDPSPHVVNYLGLLWETQIKEFVFVCKMGKNEREL